MKNENCNNRHPLITLFTLLGIFAGFILYTILKQEKKTEDGRHGEKVEKTRKIEKTIKKLNKPQKKNDGNIIKELSERQQRIVALLEKEGKIYPSQLQELLPNVSTRTIRRDMTDLEKKNIVEQKGSTKSTYYIYTK